ncbi:MAG: hypothetical protein SGI72_12810 [Planctomycetota bacterium]|nr:hypothetical protein [Planctomycetota bacterium]
MILAIALALVPQQEAAPPAEIPRVSVESEVLANVKNQALGKTTVDALALPDEYLKRVSDRIIRTTFEQRYRVVVPDPPPQSSMPPPNASKPVDSTTFQPPSAVGMPLVIGTVFLLAFVAYLLITARARKETPL